MMNRKAFVFCLWQKLFSMCIKPKNKSGIPFRFCMAGTSPGYKVTEAISELILPHSHYREYTVFSYKS